MKDTDSNRKTHSGLCIKACSGLMGRDGIEDEDSAETEMVKLDYLAIVQSFEECQMHTRFLKSSGYVDIEKKD